jgi:hypothetical protein
MKTLQITLVLLAMLLCNNFSLAQINGNTTYNDTTALEMPKIDTAAADSTGYRANFKFSKKDIQKIIKSIKYSKEIYQIVKRDYSSLFKMNGFHPHLGYSYQGINTFYYGVGYGKRDLFKPTEYSNIHGGFITTPSQNYDPNIGVHLGYTKAKLFTFWGIEADALNHSNNGLSLVVRPEIGLTVIGSFNIGYGYGFNLSETNSSMGGHTFTIRYTHQFLKKNIERKVKEFNFIFRKDYQRLKEIGLDLAQ